MDCYRNPNYKKCPDRMSDGRHFTSYEPNNSLNSKIRYEMGLVTGAEYRAYLTKHATKLMRQILKPHGRKMDVVLVKIYVLE